MSSNPAFRGRSLTDLLEGARAECERRMADLTSNGERGGEIPREFFHLNVMERRLRPLVYEAARLEGESPPIYTKITDDGRPIVIDHG